MKGKITNLRRDFTHEELAENGRKGGIRSGEVRRQKRAFREGLEGVLTCPVTDGEERERLEEMGLEPIYFNLVLRSVVEQAAKGKLDAVKFLRDAVDGKEEGEGAGQWEVDLAALSDRELRLLAAAAEEVDARE